MSSHDWRWNIGEAIERIRTRYDYIGRKTGAPFLALLYPPEAELAVLKEWQTQTSALRPEFDVRAIDALNITQNVICSIGAENVVASLEDPMPGSNPQSELGQFWISTLAEAVQTAFATPGVGRPVVSLQRSRSARHAWPCSVATRDEPGTSFEFLPVRQNRAGPRVCSRPA